MTSRLVQWHSLEESNGTDEGQDASRGDAAGSSGDNGRAGTLGRRVVAGRVDGDGAGGLGSLGVTGLGLGLLGLSGDGSGSSGVRTGTLRLTGVTRLARLAGGRLRVVLGLRLGDGARTVGDGESGRLSDGVGLVAVSEGGGLRAVSGDGSENLSCVDNSRDGDNGLCGLERVTDGAGAVGDSKSGLLGDSVGLVTVGEGGRSRAVGGDGGYDLGGVLSTVTVDGVVRRSIGSSDEEASSSSSLEESHCDGLRGWN